jgi:hypothetical protein
MLVLLCPASSSPDIVNSVGMGIIEDSMPLKKSPIKPYFMKKEL